MAKNRVGKQTVVLELSKILSFATIVGKKEGEGPLGSEFDEVVEDIMFGEKTWEKAESKFVRETFAKVLKKGNVSMEQVDYVIAGDLLNQCIGASFGLRESDIPFLGVYGACSTMAESMSIGSMLVNASYADQIVCMTSSHFCSAEKQFRYPLEFGAQRTPTSQWTVTGCGGVLLGQGNKGLIITNVTNGKIIDFGVKDSNNMGAAMAPAAADTIKAHLEDTKRSIDYYDLIVTGDLGKLGAEICLDLLKKQNIDITDTYNDCGLMIYDLEKQGVDCGGSGCGCSGSVLCGHILPQMNNYKLNKVLFVATGALLSPVSVQQKETIPCVAHAIAIERK